MVAGIRRKCQIGGKPIASFEFDALQALAAGVDEHRIASTIRRRDDQIAKIEQE